MGTLRTVDLMIVGMAVLFVAGVLTGSSYADKTCVGMWLFDDDKDGIATDSSENGNDGGFEGNPKWADGKFDGALELGGAGDYVDAGDPENESLDFGTGDFTIVGWLKHASAAATRGVVVKRNWSPTTNAGFQLQLQTDNNLHLYFCDGSAARLNGSSDSVFADDTWHHFALVFDRDKKVTFYRDGIADGSVDISGQRKSISNDRHLRIGAGEGPAGPSDFFNGLLDEVALFNVALAEEDIQTIMNEGLKGISPVDRAGRLTTTWATIKVR